MNPIALTTTVVSKDVDLLREISWCLTAYGYKTQTSQSFAPLLATWQASPPDFLIVDYEHPDLGAISKLPHVGKDAFTYKILFCDLSEPMDRVAELEYSFNDVISKPLNLGELLARLRAGAEFIEFERDLRQRSLCDPCTGLLSRNALLQTLQLADDSVQGKSPEQVGLALVSVDFFSDYAVRFGVEVSDHLLCQAADALEASAGEQAWIARIGDHAFALAFVNNSVDRVEQCAEKIHQEFAAREFSAGAAAIRMTVTVCVTSLPTSCEDAEDVLAEAEKNLRFAEALGGSTTSRCGQFDQAYADWFKRHISSGAAAATMTARDIMTPFTAFLKEPELTDQYIAAIRASEIAVAPYLDREGGYLGILQGSAWHETRRSDFAAAIETPPEVSARATCADLVEQFTDHCEELLVVMGDRKPIGYITRQAMAEIQAPAANRRP